MSVRCLIVDDNPAFLRAAATLLEREGLRVVGVATAGAEALWLARELRPDVALVDITLGPESGFDLTRRLVETSPGTRTILIVLYIAINLPLAVWMTRAFFMEVPRELIEAAEIDGTKLFNQLRSVILPIAAPGIAATALLCVIFAWNEYAFAVLLTSGDAQTMPPFIPFIIGEGGQDWPAVAAATTLFFLPILLFTILLRRHLLRGITFGAVRK